MGACAMQSTTCRTLVWQADRHLALHLLVSDAGLELEPVTRYELAGEPSLLPELSAVDLAIGASQLHLLETASGVLYTWNPTTGRLERRPCVKSLFTRPTAIASIPGTLLVADPAGRYRLVALAEASGQIRWTVDAGRDAAGRSLGLPLPFLPVDLAADRAGRLYALAPLAVTGASVPFAVLVFDPGGRLVRTLQSPGLAVDTPVGRLALAVGPDGVVFVLDAPGRRVFVLSPNGVRSFPVDHEPAGLAIDSAGHLYVGDGRREILPGEEDDRFLHRFDGDGRHLGVVTGYRGAVGALAIDAKDRIYVFDPQTRRLLDLARRTGLRQPPAGVFYSPALDSGEAGERWHKLRLDAEIPRDAQVRVSYLVLEDKEPYETILGEPSTSAEEKAAALNLLEWSAPPQVNALDALLIAGPGRYLCLRIELAAAGLEGPRVRRVEAWFPRLSYLRYLPAVYQEDATSRDFLERFLALFETFFAGIERQIDRLPRTFDADAASGELLTWLASWLALAADEEWSEKQLRSLVRRAPELFRLRGTRAGLEALVEIAIGQKPWILEAFQLDGVRDPAVRQIYTRLFGDDPYGFSVLLAPSMVRRQDDQRAVRRLVEAEKPAHTRAFVRVLQPWVQLDMHTYLELNTYLTRPSSRLGTGAALTRFAVLDDPGTNGQLGIRTRIGIDTSLT